MKLPYNPGRALLLLLARKLAQWASALHAKALLPDEQGGTPQPTADAATASSPAPAPAGPPAHWVERVRQAAPQLLQPGAFTHGVSPLSPRPDSPSPTRSLAPSPPPAASRNRPFDKLRPGLAPARSRGPWLTAPSPGQPAPPPQYGEQLAAPPSAPRRSVSAKAGPSPDLAAGPSDGSQGVAGLTSSSEMPPAPPAAGRSPELPAPSTVRYPGRSPLRAPLAPTFAAGETSETGAARAQAHDASSTRLGPKAAAPAPAFPGTKATAGPVPAHWPAPRPTIAPARAPDDGRSPDAAPGPSRTPSGFPAEFRANPASEVAAPRFAESGEASRLRSTASPVAHSWQHVVTRPATRNFSTPPPASHTRPESPASADRPRSTNRTGQPWPELPPPAVPDSMEEWQAIVRAQEHRRRLDREQEGTPWTV